MSDDRRMTPEEYARHLLSRPDPEEVSAMPGESPYARWARWALSRPDAAPPCDFCDGDLRRHSDECVYRQAQRLRCAEAVDEWDGPQLPLPSPYWHPLAVERTQGTPVNPGAYQRLAHLQRELAGYRYSPWRIRRLRAKRALRTMLLPRRSNVLDMLALTIIVLLLSLFVQGYFPVVAPVAVLWMVIYALLLHTWLGWKFWQAYRRER